MKIAKGKRSLLKEKVTIPALSVVSKVSLISPFLDFDTISASHDENHSFTASSRIVFMFLLGSARFSYSSRNIIV